MTLLADSIPSANSVWVVLVALGSLAGNLATVGIFVASRRRQQTEISPAPLVVALEKDFATKSEFEAQKRHCADRHSQLFAAISKVERDKASEIEQKVEIARKEIVEVGKKVASLETAAELQNQKMASMDAKLDRLIERP